MADEHRRNQDGEPRGSHGYDVLIVGAGPAGISMAVECRRAGIAADRIAVFEKGAVHAWSIRKLYADDKLVTANFKGNEAVCRGVLCIPDLGKDDVLSYLDKAIRDHDIHVRYEEGVHAIEPLDGGGFLVTTQKGSYRGRICVIAIGVFGRPRKPDYKIPAAVRKRVHFTVNSTKIENAAVLVVGGGDSASEYVQYLVQLGNRVTLSYRRAEFTRMNDLNRASLLALEERGEARVLRSSTVTKLEVAGDRPRVVFADGEPEVFDHIVYALGGTTPEDFLKKIGIEFEGRRPKVRRGYETTVPGLFLIGDLGQAGGSIVTAFNSAHDAMQKILETHLGCHARTPERRGVSGPGAVSGSNEPDRTPPD